MNNNDNKKQNNMIFDNIKSLSNILSSNSLSMLRTNIKSSREDLDRYNHALKQKELSIAKQKEVAISLAAAQSEPKSVENVVKVDSTPTQPTSPTQTVSESVEVRPNNVPNNGPTATYNDNRNNNPNYRPYNNNYNNNNNATHNPNAPRTYNTPYNPNAPRTYNNAPYNNTQNNPNAPRTYNTPYNPNAPRTYNTPYNPNAPRTYNTPYNPNAPRTYNTPYNPNAPRTYNTPYNPNAPRPPYNPNAPRPPYNPNFRPYNNTSQIGQRPYNPNFSVQRPGMGSNNGFNRPNLDRPPIAQPQRNFGNKNKTDKHFEEKRAYDKRTLLRRGLIEEQNIEDRMLTRMYRTKKKVREVINQYNTNTVGIITTNNLTVKVLSETIGKSASEIIKKFILLGMMVTINSPIDFASAELVAGELGMTLEQRVAQTSEEKLTNIQTNLKSYADNEAITRPPVVTIMGHVDHGKTSLLDHIRKACVAEGEAGGITQHIGAYQVQTSRGKITFVDTPGHEAFVSMRLRGAMLTDIAILIVAADDGIMPQTAEAIRHIKAAKVPMIVAINKMDKESANPDRILQQLTEHEIIPEAWGGDAIIVPLSAKTGDGIDKLLDMIILIAEMQQLKANPNVSAFGTIIESNLDIGRGAMASLIIKDGTLKKGDTIVSGLTSCRVKLMYDDTGKELLTAPPSTPVKVIGFSEVPTAGEVFTVIEEKLVKEILAERKAKIRIDMSKSTSATSLEEMISNVNIVDAKVQNVIIKSDVGGSLEAIKQALNALSNDETKVNILGGGVGNVFESDIVLAEASNATILAFNTKIDSKAKALADRQKVSIKSYKIIYQLIDDVSKLLKSLITPTYRKEILGQAEVRMVFNLSTNGAVAGSMVKDGKIMRNKRARVYRNDEIIADDLTINSLKILKDDVKEANKGYECGIKLNGFDAYKEGDIIECFSLVVEEK